MRKVYVFLFTVTEATALYLSYNFYSAVKFALQSGSLTENCIANNSASLIVSYRMTGSSDWVNLATYNSSGNSHCTNNNDVQNYL